jgi:5-methylcytosine-specific restriction endonuclease McrA
MAIPQGIERKHIESAIARFDAGAEHLFHDSTKYDLVYQGRRYPPKAIVGLAAAELTGKPLVPEDFSGGLGSLCFNILKRNGFQIELKPIGCWIFQGNPTRYDIDRYIGEYSYIYWRCPKFRDEVKVGDRCMIWRSGHNSGGIAIGKIVEAPVSSEEVRFPDCLGKELWASGEGSDEGIVVGIEVLESRLDEEDGFLPRSTLKEDPLLANSTLILSPQATVFRLYSDEAEALFRLWGSPDAPLDQTVPEAFEGARRLRQHYARERNRAIIEHKKEQFRKAHQGRVFCEICGFEFAKEYPTNLGTGFIEVHHIEPLSSAGSDRRTRLEDLMLLCANCHRMVHRSKAVAENLAELKGWFDRHKDYVS